MVVWVLVCSVVQAAPPRLLPSAAQAGSWAADLREEGARRAHSPCSVGARLIPRLPDHPGCGLSGSGMWAIRIRDADPGCGL